MNDKRAEILTSDEYFQDNFAGKDIMEEDNKQGEDFWLKNILKEGLCQKN